MQRSITASRVAGLVGTFDRRPAYAGLADALVLLIGDGRLPAGVRLPSERDLTAALGVSRTTVTRAYAVLREAGFVAAQQGAGTFTRLPGGVARPYDRALLPHRGDVDAIDLNCAAPYAPPGLSAVYAAALDRLPAHLGGHGYFPAGLPELQAAVAATYDARGLPTDPDQIMITPGALAAVTVVSHALAEPGDRVLVENPGYPNAAERWRAATTRIATTDVDPDGWDLAATAATVRQVAPRLAYLVPDFHNPTGLLMSDPERERYAAVLAQHRVTAVVDESHAALALEGQPLPLPFAAHAPEAISVGSISKSVWGGLRVGWIRAPHRLLPKLTRARVTLDLGVPVLEQLAAAGLLADPDEVLAGHRLALRHQRDALVTGLRAALPDWRFRVPAGGLSLWCELPGTAGRGGPGPGVALADEAERHGVIVAPGPVFAPDGGLDRFVRVPFTRRVEELETAVQRLAAAWAVMVDRGTGRSPERRRVMVA